MILFSLTLLFAPLPSGTQFEMHDKFQDGFRLFQLLDLWSPEDDFRCRITWRLIIHQYCPDSVQHCWLSWALYFVSKPSTFVSKIYNLHTASIFPLFITELPKITKLLCNFSLKNYFVRIISTLTRCAWVFFKGFESWECYGSCDEILMNKNGD